MSAQSGLLVSDIMTTHVVSLSASQTLREASAVMSRNNLSGAPVVDGEAVVGVLSTSDILDFIASNSEGGVQSPAEKPDHTVSWQLPAAPGVIQGAIARGEIPSVADFYKLGSDEQRDLVVTFDELAGLKLDLIDRHFVSEAMTRSVIALPPSADVLQAASYLFWAGIHRVFVMEGETLLGVVTTMDIVQAVAQRGITQL